MDLTRLESFSHPVCLASFLSFFTFLHFFSNVYQATSEMAQQVKALAPKPDDLSSVPQTRMVEGEN